MTRRVLWLTVVVILAAGGVIGGYFWSYYRSPRYALHQMVLALKNKDVDRLVNFLDLKEITKSMIDPVAKELAPPGNQEEDEWVRLGRRLGQKLAQQVLPHMVNNLEEQIRTVLKYYLNSLDNTKILAIGAAVSLADIHQQGDEALVTIKDPPKGDIYRFTMRRAQGEVNWKIVALSYNDFKKILKHELL